MTTARQAVGFLGVCLVAIWLTLGGLSERARARSLAAGGFSFSDELSGFELVGISGAGTPGDPIVITERVTTLEPSLLVIRRAGEKRAVGGTLDFFAVAIKTVVINATGRVWSGFDLELREQRDRPSVYGDGLSFDQLHSLADVAPESDRFAKSTWAAEPYDRIYFRLGSVDPGTRVALVFAVADISPIRKFYLMQQPLYLTARMAL